MSFRKFKTPLDFSASVNVPYWLIWGIVVAAFAGGGFAIATNEHCHPPLSVRDAWIEWIILSVVYMLVFFFLSHVERWINKGFDKLFGHLEDN